MGPDPTRLVGLTPCDCCPSNKRRDARNLCGGEQVGTREKEAAHKGKERASGERNPASTSLSRFASSRPREVTPCRSSPSCILPKAAPADQGRVQQSCPLSLEATMDSMSPAMGVAQYE